MTAPWATPTEQTQEPICIVDDDEWVADSLKVAARNLRVRCAVVRIGSRISCRCRRRAAGCLVIDQHMPGMNGLDVVDRLQKEGMRVPTILISGRLDTNTKERAANLGVTSVIEKPFAAAAWSTSFGRQCRNAIDGARRISVAEQRFSLCLRGELASPDRTRDTDGRHFPARNRTARDPTPGRQQSGRGKILSGGRDLCASYAGVVLVQARRSSASTFIEGGSGKCNSGLRRHVLAYLRIARIAAPGPEVRGVAAAMVVGEVEPIGGFVGSSIWEPLLQAGILLSVLGYIVHLDRWMAATVFAIFIPQLIFVPLMQGAINRRAGARVWLLRELGISTVATLRWASA